MLEATATHSRLNRLQELALTPAAQAALSINDKHREVQRLGRTAKEIAAEIGEELIRVKEEKLNHGQFIPWIEVNCSFSRKRAHEYMKVAEAKCHSRVTFDRCTSIREVLAIGKDKPTPKQELRAATLNDLRKVERLRALRDDPGAVRRQVFWDQERPNLRESLAHLVGLIMRRAGGDASGAFRASFV